MLQIRQFFNTRKRALTSSAVAVAILALAGTGTAFATETVARNTSIGSGNAQNFAFADAGVDPTSATGIRTEFDFEQGQFIYEVEFLANGTEYEYWIKASDGSIVKKEQDLIDPTISSAQKTTTPSTPQDTQQSTPAQTQQSVQLRLSNLLLLRLRNLSLLRLSSLLLLRLSSLPQLRLSNLPLLRPSNLLQLRLSRSVSTLQRQPLSAMRAFRQLMSLSPRRSWIMRMAVPSMKLNFSIIMWNMNMRLMP